MSHSKVHLIHSYVFLPSYQSWLVYQGFFFLHFIPSHIFCLWISFIPTHNLYFLNLTISLSLLWFPSLLFHTLFSPSQHFFFFSISICHVCVSVSILFLSSIPRGSHIQRLQSFFFYTSISAAVRLYHAALWCLGAKFLWSVVEPPCKGKGKFVCTPRLNSLLCARSKPSEIVHCGEMWILLTRFHSFLRLDSTISSCHLPHYSQDVLSDAGQIETHWTASLCASAHFMSVWVHACASVCVKSGLWDIADPVVYDVWHDMRRHAWNEIACQAFWGCNIHQRPDFIRLIPHQKIVFILHYASWLAVWHGSLMTHDLWQTAISQHWQTACSPTLPLQDDICELRRRCQHHSTQQIVNVISAVRLSLYLSLI